MENKTIYFSYKNNIPYFVFNRWLHLNPQYEIDFSLDEDCRQFLNNEFNINILNYFNNISRGAFKCDLWRDRKSTRLNSSHSQQSRMPSSA